MHVVTPTDTLNQGVTRMSSYISDVHLERDTKRPFHEKVYW